MLAAACLCCNTLPNTNKHLKLGLSGLCSLPKDIDDQLDTIQHRASQCYLQIALLHTTQLHIDKYPVSKNEQLAGEGVPYDRVHITPRRDTEEWCVLAFLTCCKRSKAATARAIQLCKQADADLSAWTVAAFVATSATTPDPK